MENIEIFLKSDFSRFKNLFAAGSSNEGKKTLNVPVCFDIETSTKENLSWMFAFSFSFDGRAFLGRTWEDFEQALKKLHKDLDLSNERKMTIFVHNLGFEFQFFKFRFPKKNVFFKSSRKPILVELGGEYDGIIFKDSKMLSGYSLSDWAKANNMPFRKEKIDYTKTFLPIDPLPDEVIDYMEKDVLIVDRGIRDLVKMLPYAKKNIGSVPLTKTQIVKNELFRSLYPSYTFKKVCRESELDIDTMIFLKKCFRGGSVGAPAPFEIFENVKGYDISSQYPFELLTRRFPFGKAESVEDPTPKDLEAALEMDYMFIIQFTAINITRKPGFPKFLISENVNQFWMTSVDFKLFYKFYSFNLVSVEKITFWRRYDLLFPQARRYILEKYKAKTLLKNISEKDAEYAHEKSNLNTIPGLFSQYPIRDEFYINGEKKGVSPADQLASYYNGAPRLPFQIGVFMVSWARMSLWNAIQKLGLYSCIYFDTDSIKTINPDADRIIERLNKERLAGLKKIGYNDDDISPVDSFGKAHTIGFFEKEFDEARFCAVSSKVYFVEFKDGSNKAVIGGCGIEAKEKYCKKIEQFADREWMTVPKGLKISEYIDEGFEKEINGCQISEKSFVNIREDDFSISRMKVILNFGEIDIEVK